MTRVQRKEVEKMLENNLDIDVGMAMSLLDIDKKKRQNVFKLLNGVCKYYFDIQKYIAIRSKFVVVK